MIVLAFIQWWYGRGWAEQGRAFFKRIDMVANSFSLGILVKTWFSPWKQMITTTSRNSSIEYRFRASVDNLVSRVVGFVVRSIVMFAAVVMMAVMGVACIVTVLIWPFLPVLPMLLLLISAVGVPW